MCIENGTGEQEGDEAMTTDITTALQALTAILVGIFALSMWMTARRLNRS